MTTEQVLQEAQTRVDSFKPYADRQWLETNLKDAKSIAIIAIETEIKTFESLANSFRYKYPLNINKVVYKQISDLKSILEQIPNTI